jgi:hypothetical protein
VGVVVITSKTIMLSSPAYFEVELGGGALLLVLEAVLSGHLLYGPSI